MDAGVSHDDDLLQDGPMPTSGRTEKPTTRTRLYSRRALAFIDVLGWSDLIQLSVRDTSVLTPIRSALGWMLKVRSTARRVQAAYRRAPFSGTYVLQEVAQFSDTIVMSCSPTKDPARPADSITLTAHGKQVRLTETHQAIARVTRAIEAVLPPGTHPGRAEFLMVGTTPYESSPSRS
jgi:hypothetical protein